MLKVMVQAQELVAKGKKKVTQDELEGTTAILNRAINTMRPGNLAEMEDLRELSGLLRRAGWPDDNTSEELKEAISYGRMVQKYVTDGSNPRYDSCRCGKTEEGDETIKTLKQQNK